MYWTFGVLNWGLRDLKWGLGEWCGSGSRPKCRRLPPSLPSSSSPWCSAVRLLRNACRRARKQRKKQRLEIVRAAGGGETISFVSRYEKETKKFISWWRSIIMLLLCCFEENNGLLLLLLFLSNSHFLFICSVLEVLCWWLLGGGLFVCLFFSLPPLVPFSVSVVS